MRSTLPLNGTPAAGNDNRDPPSNLGWARGGVCPWNRSSRPASAVLHLAPLFTCAAVVHDQPGQPHSAPAGQVAAAHRPAVLVAKLLEDEEGLLHLLAALQARHSIRQQHLQAAASRVREQQGNCSCVQATPGQETSRHHPNVEWQPRRSIKWRVAVLIKCKLIMQTGTSPGTDPPRQW